MLLIINKEKPLLYYTCITVTTNGCPLHCCFAACGFGSTKCTFQVILLIGKVGKAHQPPV